MREPTTPVLRAKFINVSVSQVGLQSINQVQVNQVDVSDPVKALTEQM